MSGTYTVSKISSSGNKYNRAQHHTFNTAKNGNNMTWKRKRPEKQEQPIEQEKFTSSSNSPTSQNLKRIGTNKLVSTATKKSAKPSSFSSSSNSFKNNKRSIKRVKLSREENEETSNNDESTDQSSLTSTTTTTKTALTDFAYREISSKSVCKPTTIIKKRTMGLVRINPTSVCPSILAGIPCTNVKCTKRHDVSRESVTPLCSFFQRNGSCLRKDCKFRHVKVNSNADVCVDFLKKGFCENTNCVLRHVRNRT